MKHITAILVLQFFLLFLQNSFCGYRNLIMLLDWNGETVATDFNPYSGTGPRSGFGPVTSMLVTALWQQAAPIVVTSSIWKNFVERKEIFGDFITKKQSELETKYLNKYSRFKDKDSIKTFAEECKAIYTSQPKNFSLILGFLLPYITVVDTNNWKIQKINDYIYLLIPTKYLGTIERYNDTPKNITTTNLSYENLLLGLKTGTPLINPLAIESHKTPNIKFSAEFINTLPNIFVTVKDVKTEENIATLLHDWIFFIDGHGSSEPTKEELHKAQAQFGPGATITFTTHIAGLETSDFQKLLTFFNKNIKTNFLFYETCYAGGLHLVKPYELAWFKTSPVQPEKLSRRTENIFNYTIATGTIAHVTTRSYTPSIQIPFKLTSKPIKFGQNFTEFFNKTSNYLNPKPGAKPPSLIQVLQTVHEFIDDSGNIINSMQIPGVRFPNTEWFSVIDISKKVSELSQVLVKTHEAENRPFIIKDKQVVILYADTAQTAPEVSKATPHMSISVPIKIEQDTPAVFISKVPNDTLYYFDRLEAKNWGLHDLLVNFLFVNEVGAGRKYYIKNLFVKNDLSPDQTALIGAAAQEALILNNVLIINNALDKQETKRNYGIFFQFNNNNFSAFWPSTDVQSLETLKTTKIVPNLKKEEPTITIPKYPFLIPKDDLKKVVEALEAEKKRIEEMQKSESAKKTTAETEKATSQSTPMPKPVPRTERPLPKTPSAKPPQKKAEAQEQTTHITDIQKKLEELLVQLDKLSQTLK